jgi:hypothetical protein
MLRNRTFRAGVPITKGHRRGGPRRGNVSLAHSAIFGSDVKPSIRALLCVMNETAPLPAVTDAFPTEIELIFAL